MSGYQAFENYSPLLNLFVGFFGIWGSGLLLWRNAQLPHPWDKVTAAVSGILLFGLGCQVIAVFGIATHGNLGLYLACWTCVGYAHWFSKVTNVISVGKAFDPWMLLFLIPADILRLMATSGSTKINKTYYHMLTPARIIAHQELTFFGFPWQAAIPQMGYQISESPFHAIGFPHAGNIFSCMLAAVFAFFAYSLVRQRGHSAFWASRVPATLLVGMYPAVWYVTGGAHSFGDLTVAAAVITCACFKRSSKGADRNIGHQLFTHRLLNEIREFRRHVGSSHNRTMRGR